MVRLGGLVIERDGGVGRWKTLGFTCPILLLSLDLLVMLEVFDVLRMCIAVLALCLGRIVVKLFVVLLMVNRREIGPTMNI